MTISSLESEINQLADDKYHEIFIKLIEYLESKESVSTNDLKIQYEQSLALYTSLKKFAHHYKKRYDRDLLSLDEDGKLYLTMLDNRIKRAREKYYESKRRYEERIANLSQ